MRPLKNVLISASMLVLCAAVAAPGWSADVRRTDSIGTSPSVQPAVPGSPAVRPSAAAPSVPLTGETRGKLSRSGNKVMLRLTRSVSRVDVFAGRSKVAALKSGVSFDVSPYMSRGTAAGLTFHYHGSDGRKSTQTFSPAEIRALLPGSKAEIGVTGALSSPGTVQRPGSGLRQGATTGGSSTSGSGRTLSLNPQPQSQGLSPSVPSSGIRKNLDAPRQVGATQAGRGPVSSSGLSSINITSPKLGDFMVEGGQFVLQWSGYGNIPEKCVNIDLFQGISHIAPIAQNVCVNGYEWQLPAGMSGTGYEIRVRTLDNAFSDDSDPFSIILSQPDLRITNLHIQPPNPDMADAISVRANIVNAGHDPAVPTDVTVRLRIGNSVREETFTTSNLAFGAHDAIRKDFDPNPTWGDLKVTVEVDEQGLVAEADENNNVEHLTFSLERLPNLVSCVREDYYTHIWSEVHIQFKVKNNSFVPSGPFVYRTYIEDKGEVSHPVSGLAPFETLDIRRSMNFGTAGGRNCWGIADYTGIIREYREDDNEKSGRVHSSGLAGSYPTQYPECD